MWQSGNIRVARIGGIAVDIHPTFVLVLIWGAWQGWVQYGSVAGAGYGVLSISLLFVCVLLHELGHGLQARGMGLVVRRVSLLPIGGLAQLETQPAYPWQELVIALAGPMVNLALALILGGIINAFQPISLTGWWNTLLLRVTPNLANLMLFLLWTNVILFFFNMLPAFPMDGGRVIRAALAIFTDYETATRIACWLGRLIAFGMVVVGATGWPPGRFDPNPLLLVTGIVVYFGAQQEELYVRRQRALIRMEVGDICHPAAAVLAPWDALTADALRRLREGQVVPVMVGERLVGLLTAQEVRSPAPKSAAATVAHMMRASFPVLHPNDTLWVALQEMTSVQLDSLPVVINTSFRGLVTLNDIKDAWKVLARRKRRAGSTLVSGDTVK